jgi:hypothetical protein
MTWKENQQVNFLLYEYNILQEKQTWNAYKAIAFVGMEHGTCVDHPQLWDCSSLLVSS